MNSGVHIPQPCGENWDRMTPHGNGRHCTSCDKVVVDFTKMSNDEIRMFLAKDKKNEVCGNYNSLQLERPFGDWRDTLVRAYQKAKKRKPTSGRTRFALFLTLLVFLSGCYRRTAGIRYKADNTPKRSITKTVTLSFLALTLFLSGCYRHVTRGKIRASNNDTKHHSYQKL